MNGQNFSPELFESFLRHGMTESEIEDLARAGDSGERRCYGDVAWEVDKLYAHAVLRRHGYENAEEFLEELIRIHGA